MLKGRVKIIQILSPFANRDKTPHLIIKVIIDQSLSRVGILKIVSIVAVAILTQSGIIRRVQEQQPLK